MEYYSAIRKNDHPTFASTWMGLEEIMLSEISRERQLSYGFTYMWHIRNSREIVRRRKGKMKGGQTEEEMNHEGLWTQGNNLRVLQGRGVGGCASLVKGITKGTYCMEHWVLYTNYESWNTTSKTNDILYGD